MLRSFRRVSSGLSMQEQMIVRMMVSGSWILRTGQGVLKQMWNNCWSCPYWVTWWNSGGFLFLVFLSTSTSYYTLKSVPYIWCVVGTPTWAKDASWESSFCTPRSVAQISLPTVVSTCWTFPTVQWSPQYLPTLWQLGILVKVSQNRFQVHCR